MVAKYWENYFKIIFPSGKVSIYVVISNPTSEGAQHNKKEIFQARKLPFRPISDNVCRKRYPTIFW